MTSISRHPKTKWHERFYLYRQHDATGISGTGVVAEGVRFEDGTCAMRWCVPGQAASTAVYTSITDLIAIHGLNGSTIVMWLDVPPGYAVGGVWGDTETAGHAYTDAASPALA